MTVSYSITTGSDKPASKTEAIGMSMAVMKRWMERNGGPVYEEQMRGRHFVR